MQSEQKQADGMVRKGVRGSGALHRVVRGRGALGVSRLLHAKQERDESWEEAKKRTPKPSG